MLSHPYILFIDTETTGKPADWDAPVSDVEKWPHIVQVAWIIADSDGKEVAAHNYYIEARDYSIRKKAERIHGISEEMANQLGVTRKEALKALYKDLKRYKPLIVGHFIKLDLHMLQAGFNRAGLKNILRDYSVFCTMMATSEYMHLNHRNYPQLGELYQMLFKKRMENEHDAEGDARAVASCFFELVRREEVDDDVIREQSKKFKKTESKQRKTGCGLPAIFMFIIILTTAWLW